jgi:hypothetical protein
MNPEVEQIIRQRLATFASWLGDQSVTFCRLVQYVGPDCFAIDVPLTQAPSQIEGLLAEGFSVDWATQGSRLYLRVWEGDSDGPPWPAVFLEAHLDNETEEPSQ